MSQTMYALTTIKKSPIKVWDDSAVSTWIKSLSLDEEITMDLSTAVLINQITGANLLQAKTKKKMINLFKGGGNLGYNLNVRVAQFLINAVRKVEMEYNARLLSNQQKFIQTNTNKMVQRLQQYDKEYFHQNANTANGWKLKKVEDWSMSDTQNWVNTLNLSLEQKQNILTGFIKGHRNGQYLLLVVDGMEIANDHITFGNTICIELGQLLYRQIKSLKKFRKKRKKQAEIKDEDNNHDDDDIVMRHMYKDKYGLKTNKVGWWNKAIEKWSSEDVKEWIKSLKLQKKDEKLIIESIVCTGCTGADFKECTNGKDIAASFEYDFSNSKIFFNYLYKQLQNVIKHDANDVESDNDDVELSQLLFRKKRKKHVHAEIKDEDNDNNKLSQIKIVKLSQNVNARKNEIIDLKEKITVLQRKLKQQEQILLETMTFSSSKIETLEKQIINEKKRTKEKQKEILRLKRKIFEQQIYEKKEDRHVQIKGKEKFDTWLCDVVRLGIYKTIFEQEQYDDISLVEFIDNVVLDELKVKRMHKKLILKQVEIFKKATTQFSQIVNEMNKKIKIDPEIFIKNGILTLSHFKLDVKHQNDLKQLLQIQDQNQINVIWQRFHANQMEEDINIDFLNEGNKITEYHAH